MAAGACGESSQGARLYTCVGGVRQGPGRRPDGGRPGSSHHRQGGRGLLPAAFFRGVHGLGTGASARAGTGSTAALPAVCHRAPQAHRWRDAVQHLQAGREARRVAVVRGSAAFRRQLLLLAGRPGDLLQVVPALGGRLSAGQACCLRPLEALLARLAGRHCRPRRTAERTHPALRWRVHGSRGDLLAWAPARGPRESGGSRGALQRSHWRFSALLLCVPCRAAAPEHGQSDRRLADRAPDLGRPAQGSVARVAAARGNAGLAGAGRRTPPARVLRRRPHRVRPRGLPQARRPLCRVAPGSHARRPRRAPLGVAGDEALCIRLSAHAFRFIGHRVLAPAVSDRLGGSPARPVRAPRLGPVSGGGPDPAGVGISPRREVPRGSPGPDADHARDGARTVPPIGHPRL